MVGGGRRDGLRTRSEGELLAGSGRPGRWLVVLRVRGRRRAHEPPEVARAIQPDQDLAQESLEGHRLAPELEHVDRGVDDRRFRGLDRERDAWPAFGLREHPVRRAEVRVAGAAGQRLEGLVRPGPGAPRHGPGSGRHQLHHPARIPARLGKPRAGHAVPGGDATQRAGDERLRAVTLEQQDDACVPGHHRLGGPQRAGDRRGLPAPRRADHRPEQRLERERRRRLAAEHPRGPVVCPREALRDRAQGRRAHGEPDARPDAHAGPVAGLDPQGVERRGCALLDDGGRGTLGEAAEVVAEARGDGAPRPALQALDEAPHDPDPVLEGEPRVPLAPLRVARQLDVAAGDPERRHPPGRRGQPARRGDRVQQREAHGGADRGRPEIALGPLEDRGQRHQLAGRVEVQQLVDERLATVERGEPVAELVADLGAIRGPSRARCRSRPRGPGGSRRRPAGRGRPGSGSACGSGAGRRAVRHRPSTPRPRSHRPGSPPGHRWRSGWRSGP